VLAGHGSACVNQQVDFYKHLAMGFIFEKVPNTTLSKSDQEIELIMWGCTIGFL
jgi:hypothetical protein